MIVPATGVNLPYIAQIVSDIKKRKKRSYKLTILAGDLRVWYDYLYNAEYIGICYFLRPFGVLP
jgi:hypothetical protein